MRIDRACAIKLGGFAGSVAVLGACRHFGLEELPGLLGAGLAAVAATAHAGAGHMVLDWVKDIAERGGDDVRGVQNRDLHRLMGVAIANVLEREAGHALFGADYLRRAAKAFRGAEWMEAELTGPETAVGEPASQVYFTGDAESIKKTPVLEPGEWSALVERVSGPPTMAEYRVLGYAATKLREQFAFELWEASKHAWKKGDLAWPALILRLLSLILGHASAAATQTAELRKEIAALSAAIGKAVPRVTATPADQEMLRAIREYQDDLNTKLDRNFQKVFDQLAEVKAALANARVAPVKEPAINLPNTTKEILARDREARELLEALRPAGPGIVSITAPPGLGKSAVFALALRMALPNGDPRQAGLDGIAVLDAKATAPGIASFAQLVGRMTGLQETAARFQSASAERATEQPEAGLRSLFFDFLRQAGKVWLVVENAEAVLANTPVGFRDLMKSWCLADHQAKLLLLTRHAPHSTPQCYRRLSAVELALLGGLPPDAAVELLRQRLAHTRFRATGEPLLRQIVQRLHRVPMALEQFAGYLDWNEQGVELDARFLAQNDLLRLHSPDEIEGVLLGTIGQTLSLLDAASLSLLRVVAWAAMPVPASGLLALQPDGPALLTRLVRSNLLLEREGTVAEGRSFDMHPLIREALTDLAGAALDLAQVAEVFLNAGNSECNGGQFRPALSLYALAERIKRTAGERNDLAAAIMNRGVALRDLGRLDEAVTAYDESIAIYRELVAGEHRRQLKNDLAGAIMNRGIALSSLGRLEEAVTAYGESITILRPLVEGEQRGRLRNLLATAINNRGNALTRLDRLEEAVTAYDESIGFYRELVEREHRRELRNDLAMAIMNRGSALWYLDRSEEAVTAYDESISIRRELVEGEHRQELRNDLAMAVMNRGSALWYLGRLEEAVTAYDESIAIRRELVEGEHRQELRNDLATAIMNRGSALRNLGRLEEAVTAYGESIAIRRLLVKGEQRQELRNDLAVAIMNRGNALRTLGRLEEAVTAYDESVAIFRELVEGEHRRELRNHLARALYNLALAREKQGAAPAALEAAREARQLWEDLVNEGMKHLEPYLASARALEARLTGGQ